MRGRTSRVQKKDQTRRRRLSAVETAEVFLPRKPGDSIALRTKQLELLGREQELELARLEYEILRDEEEG